MKFFKNYSLMRLRNQEFPAAYGKIFSIIENEEITVEYLINAIERVRNHKSKLVILKNMNYKHPNTKTIGELKIKRHDAFISLKGRAKYGLRSPIDSEREASEVLNAWLQRHRKHLVRASIHEQSSVANEMKDDVVTNTAIQDAMTELGAIATFDSIQVFTNQIDRLFVKRNKDLQEMARKAYKFKNEAYSDLVMLFNSIEMAIVMGDGDEAVLLNFVKEINGIMQVFKAKYERRTSRSRNAGEETDDNLSEPSLDETDEDSEESVENSVNTTDITDTNPNETVMDTTKLFNNLSENGNTNGDSFTDASIVKKNSPADDFFDQES